MENLTGAPSIGFGHCSFATVLVGTIVGTFIIYLPVILLFLVAILLVRRAHRRKQKTYAILAGFLLMSALGYRVYLSLNGMPLIFPFGCI